MCVDSYLMLDGLLDVMKGGASQIELKSQSLVFSPPLGNGAMVLLTLLVAGQGHWTAWVEFEQLPVLAGLVVSLSSPEGFLW